MNTKEAEVLDYVLYNTDQTLTADRIAAHLQMPLEEIQDILTELEEQRLITVAGISPEGYAYGICPTIQAEQEFGTDIREDAAFTPSIDPLQTHRRTGTQA